MVSYNFFNSQFTNIGAGISIKAGPVQFYAVSDNVPGLIWYKSTNNSSLRFGINIAINRKATPPSPDPQTDVPPPETKE